MNLSERDLEWAVGKGIISSEQRQQLLDAFKGRESNRPKFDFANLLFYFGAMIVISGMTWFMTLGWSTFGPLGGTVIAASYALLFNLAGAGLWYGLKMKTPGGLMFTIAVCMIPLIVYGILELGGNNPDLPGDWERHWWWSRGRNGYLMMEFITILAGLMTVVFIRFPFLTMPIAVSAFFMTFDIIPLLTGRDYWSYWAHDWNWVAVAFGTVMILISYLADRRTEEDFSFWGYFFGVLAFWFGLTLMTGGTQLTKFIYCMINLGMMLSSILLERRIFMVFGAMGVFGYLGYLAWDVFKDSIMFPFALCGIGLLLIGFGVVYQLNKQSIQAFVKNLIPEAFRRALPQNRAGAKA